MSPRENPLHLSFSLGLWFGTDVRISWFLPLMLVPMILKLGTEYGLAVGAILFTSVLLHEFGHVIAARRTGGRAEEILLWPFGGLAYARSGPGLSAEFLTILGGPLVNLVLVMMTLPHVLSTTYGWSVLNPLELPIPQSDFGKSPLSDALVLTCSLNWISLLFNLLPIIPLDGGRMFQAWATDRSGRLPGADLTSKVGLWATIAVGLIAFFFEAPWLMGASFVLGLLVILETQRIIMSQVYDEAFLGYGGDSEFATAYEEEVEPPRKQSFWERWHQRREEERLRRVRELELEVETQLDAILEKVHQSGRESLTEQERRILERASAKFRERGGKTADS